MTGQTSCSWINAAFGFYLFSPLTDLDIIEAYSSPGKTSGKWQLQFASYRYLVCFLTGVPGGTSPLQDLLRQSRLLIVVFSSVVPQSSHFHLV